MYKKYWSQISVWHNHECLYWNNQEGFQYMNASTLWYAHAMGHVSDQKKWCIKSWKDTEKPEIHIGKLKRIICKGSILHDSKYLTFWKRWNYKGNKNSNSAQRLARVGEMAKVWKILRQCEDFLGYCHGGHVTAVKMHGTVQWIETSQD